MSAPRGQTIGGYAILAELGRGGMGVVYRARGADGREVAIKLLLSEGEASAAALERFRREIAAASAVQHRNVIRILGSGQERGFPFFALELAAGGSLKQRVRSAGKLPWQDAARLGAEIAHGLGAIHAAGFVHRDLKPDNVLLDAEGRAKISDFGLARQRASGLTKGGLTRTGELVGTLDYMAPEQTDDAAKVDGRADLYALGGLIFTLLTGEPPFQGSGMALIAKHLREQPRAPGTLVAEVPPGLDALVLSLLAKTPDERPDKAEDVAAELDAILQGKGETPPRPRAKTIAAGAAVLVLALALAFVLAPRTPAPVVTLPLPTKPVPPPPPLPVFPSECRTFLSSGGKTLTLAATSGEFRDTHDHAVVCALDGDRRITVTEDLNEDGLVKSVALWSSRKARRLIYRGNPVARDAAFLGDEAVLVLADGSARLWNLAVGAQLDTVGPRALAVAGSRGRKLVATAGADETVRILGPGLKEVRSLVHPGLVRAVVFSPDGRRVLTGSDDGQVRLWEIETGKLLLTLDALTGTITCVAVSPDGKRGAAMGRERGATGGPTNVAVFGLEDGGRLLPSPPPQPWSASAHAMAFGGSSDLLLLVPQDRRLHQVTTWNVRTGEASLIPTLGGFNTSVVATEDRRYAICGDQFGVLPFIDLAKCEEVEDQHLQEISRVAFKGSSLVSASFDGTIRTWDAAGRPAGCANGPDRKDRIPDGINDFALAMTGETAIASLYRNERALIAFDLRREERRDDLLFANTGGANVLGVSFAPDGETIASGDDVGRLQLWEASTGLPRGEPVPIAGTYVFLQTLAFSPSGRHLAASGSGGRIWVVEVGTGATLWSSAEIYKGNFNERTPAVLVDDERVLWGNGLGEVRFRNMTSGSERRLRESGSPVTALAVFARGTRAFVCDTDGALQILDLASGELLDQLSFGAVDDFVRAIAVSPDERSLAIGTHHGMVLRFDLRSG
jgi:serine/threonine protein kinase/WD40 repeat protein